jgi:hypothetical protein
LGVAILDTARQAARQSIFFHHRRFYQNRASGLMQRCVNSDTPEPDRFGRRTKKNRLIDGHRRPAFPSPDFPLPEDLIIPLSQDTEYPAACPLGSLSPHVLCGDEHVRSRNGGLAAPFLGVAIYDTARQATQ